MVGSMDGTLSVAEGAGNGLKGCCRHGCVMAVVLEMSRGLSACDENWASLPREGGLRFKVIGWPVS